MTVKRTDRLELYFRDHNMNYDGMCFDEFELESGGQATIEDTVPVFPSTFQWSDFREFFRYKPDSIFHLDVGDIEYWYSQHGRIVCQGQVLWLSQTIFVTTINFILSDKDTFRDQRMFQYAVSVSPELTCYAYSLSSFAATCPEQVVEIAPSALPLHFFQHLTSHLSTGQLKFLELINGVPCFPARLCTLFMYIFPRREANVRLTPDETIIFNFRFYGEECKLDEAQLTAITMHPCSVAATVRLLSFQDSVNLDRVNTLLRDSQHLMNLHVPEELIAFNSDEISFTANQHFHSLTIPKFSDIKISLNLLDGIALNVGLQEFHIDFSGRKLADFRENLEYLFRHVLPKCCSLSHVALNLRDEDRHHDQPRDAFFEEVEQIIHMSSPAASSSVLNRFGSVFSLKLTHSVEHSRKIWYTPASPTETWDKLVSPSLVLSWCRHQRNEQSWATSPRLLLPSGLIGRMVHLTNRNVVYAKTAHYLSEKGLSPFDPSIANASVIYETLRMFHPSLGQRR
jgi:hypothetical protein